MATQPIQHPSFPVDLLPPRATIAAAVETLLAVLDVLDGDPDVEANGDELDGFASEDEPLFQGEHPGGFRAHGPGCAISDPDFGREEEGEPDEGGPHGRWGIDQERPIGAGNPEWTGRGR